VAKWVDDEGDRASQRREDLERLDDTLERTGDRHVTCHAPKTIANAHGILT
jgi:hypothetical protein